MLRRKLYNLLRQGGMATEPWIRRWFRQGAVEINGVVAEESAEVVPGDDIVIDGQHHYRVDTIPGTQRWHVEATSPPPQRIGGAVRAHCGQHKCLTMYVRSVLAETFNSHFNRDLTFMHFFGRVDQFYRYADQWSVCSISGHRLPLEKFEDIRVTRFIRDPRDLVVSSYFYHKRAAENWCTFKNLRQQDLARVNGAVPSAIPKGESLAGYLNACSIEDGLRAEIEFRRPHFESMLGWPDDGRVKVFRYEEILGNEARVFFDLCRHLQLPLPTQLTAAYKGHKLRAARARRHDPHIRDASAGQWREYFTPDLIRMFDREYDELLDALGYPPGGK